MNDNRVVVEWTVPDTEPNALYGDGATRSERILPPVIATVGVGALIYYAAVLEGLGWSWWQYLLAVVLAYDLIGGVVAMGLNSAKRFQHAESIPLRRPSARLIRNEVLFTAIHLQPIVIAWLFPGSTIWWGLFWYAVALGGVLLIRRTPLYLARPVAMSAVALAPVIGTLLTAPAGFGWLPAVLIAKLVLGSVREEPYRPVGG